MLIVFPELQLWLDVDDSRDAVLRRRDGTWHVELVEDDDDDDVRIVGIGAGPSLFEATRDAVALALGKGLLAMC